MISDDEEEKTSSGPPAQATGPVKTIEEWARAKGMLPALITTPARMGSRQVQMPRQNPKLVLYTQAKAHRQWPEGKEVTEAEFDAAVMEAGQVGIQ